MQQEEASMQQEEEEGGSRSSFAYTPSFMDGGGEWVVEDPLKDMSDEQLAQVMSLGRGGEDAQRSAVFSDLPDLQLAGPAGHITAGHSEWDDLL